MMRVGGCVICGKGPYNCECTPEQFDHYRKMEMEKSEKQRRVQDAERAVIEAAEETYDDTCYCTLCKAVAELKAERGGGGEDGRSKAG